MAKTLKPETISDLSLASATRLATIFSGLKPNLARNKWLKSRNVYRLDIVNRIDADTAASGGGINSPQLAEYIAASVPLHCTDGWSFLARSLSCYINGNPSQAAHFAYYAELRAAMSILAAQGIGIFNNKHFVVTAGGGCQQIRRSFGTHDMAWLALEHWAQTAASGNALLDLFIVSRYTAREWFQNRTGSAGSLAGQWLKEWGLDLSVLGEDHIIRNASSYRPNEFGPLQTDARACSDFLRSLWALFQPSTNRFETLDRHLLRMLVKKTYGLAGRRAVSTNLRFVRYVKTMLAGLGMSDAERAQLEEFLISPVSEPDLLVKAEALGPRGDGNAHERVISRAALLLRIASGFTAKLIDNAVFRAEDLQFWTYPWAERRAFWSPGSALDDMTDLWADISDAVEEEADWFTEQGPGAISMHQWRNQRDETIRPLTECDRVALWGMQP